MIHLNTTYHLSICFLFDPSLMMIDFLSFLASSWIVVYYSIFFILSLLVIYCFIMPPCDLLCYYYHIFQFYIYLKPHEPLLLFYLGSIHLDKLPLAITNLFIVSIDFSFSGILYSWNLTIYSLFRLTSFTDKYVVMFSPCLPVLGNFLLFLLNNVCGIDIPQVTHHSPIEGYLGCF